LQSRVTKLEVENKELRTHLKGALETAVNDAKNIIQSSQESDFRDLQNAFGGKFRDLQASIRIPRDGVDGAVGPVGPRGECTIPNTDEVARELIAIRLKLARFQAAVLFAYAQNYGTKHRGLRTALEHTLRAIENQSGIYADRNELAEIRRIAGL
jgi:hypothetical protein